MTCVVACKAQEEKKKKKKKKKKEMAAPTGGDDFVGGRLCRWQPEHPSCEDGEMTSTVQGRRNSIRIGIQVGNSGRVLRNGMVSADLPDQFGDRARQSVDIKNVWKRMKHVHAAGSVMKSAADDARRRRRGRFDLGQYSYAASPAQYQYIVDNRLSRLNTEHRATHRAGGENSEVRQGFREESDKVEQSHLLWARQL